MSGDSELADFTGSLGDQLVGLESADAGGSAERLRRAGLLDLAIDTVELEDATRWLVGAVRTVATRSASAAFALSARYVAERALFRCDAQGGVDEPTAVRRAAGAVSSGSSVAPALFSPSHVLVLDGGGGAGRLVEWVTDGSPGSQRGRTGLANAKLTEVITSGDGIERLELPPGLAAEAAADWDLLLAATCLGVSLAAIRAASEYALARVQFGSPIASYTGLRAIIAEMSTRTASVEGLVLGVTEGDLHPAHAATAAGRAAVETCLDAIQVHGGYGYIEEYPVAGLLRDAVSLRARGGGRRESLSRVASLQLGPVGVVTR